MQSPASRKARIGRRRPYDERPRGPWTWSVEDEIVILRHSGRTNFWFFFLHVFGMATNPKAQRWVDPEVHEPLARWFQKHVEEWEDDRKWNGERIAKGMSPNPQPRHLCIVVHREIGKTTLITRAGQLWLHLRDPELATAIGSEKEELSKKMLEAIKSIWDGSDDHAIWNVLYGNWAESSRKWSGKEVVHAARRNTSRQDPSIVVFGVETSLTGSHPDAIFYDDPISYERLTTDTNWLEAVDSQVGSLIPVLQGDGLLVWVGTRYDDMDHFGKAFRDHGIVSVEGMQSDKLPISEDGTTHVYFMAGRDAKGNPTTPRVWPESRLKSYEKSQPIRYAAQILNDPSRSALNPITQEQIEQCYIDKKEVPWSALRFVICCDTAFSDGTRIAGKDETVMLVHGLPRNGSGDVYVIEGYGNASMRAEDLGKMLVTTVQRYRKLGYKVIAIFDEKTRAGKKGSWELNLKNFFHDANEPMPRFHEFERGNTKKYERLQSAATFWVDGHVRVIRGAPGIDRLTEQMGRIGQYAVNPRIKIDWADAHSDVFQPPEMGGVYQTMKRQVAVGPWERGAQPIAMDGMDQRMFEDDETRGWRNLVPREPIA